VCIMSLACLSSFILFDFLLLVDVVLKPNSITLASSELAPNMFGASSQLVRS